MKLCYILFLIWIKTVDIVHGVVTWTAPTDGASDSFSEGTNVDTVLKTLAANTATIYTIVSQTPDQGKFDILNTNELQLIATLNFETQPSYSIVLRADDGGGTSADITYTVTVTDVNEAPVFVPNTATVTVDSGTDSGSIFDASTSVSDPEGDTITYSISGDDLTINADGVVTPAKILTYTTASPSITATITASDGTLSGILTLTVNIRPVTWTTPTDGTSDSYAENTAVNTVIKTLAADAAVSYTIVEQTPSGKFAIQNTNELQLAAALDFETDTSYAITLRATDDGGGHSADISYTVTVTNVNEAPVFDPNTFSVTVDSGIISGTVHDASTQVSDPESDTLTYTISGDDLSINADGVVSPAKRLTYTTASPSITATITASDGTLSGILTLTVNIRPVTWTTPTDGTSDSYAENTAVNTVIKTLAADAAVSYTIVEQTPSGKFAIQNTNELQLAAALDFETDTSYAITLRATDDGGGQSADISYTVTVTNVNEAPVFDPNTFSVTVDSGIISGTVHDASSQVSDPESDTITYTISGDDLSINADGVVSPAKRLTYTTASPSITATITASDGTLSGILTLTVNIRPVTWTTPTDGTSDSYAENTAVNTVIKTLAADAAVSYTIVEQTPSGKFAIQNTNELQLAAALDFETETSYAITLRATDDGGGQSADISYTVTVTNVNEAPVFDPKTFSVTVDSGIISGTVQDASTQVSDPESDTLTYTISGDDLTINADGVVSPAKRLTYTTASPSITATITASDGTLSGILTLTVNIRPVTWTTPTDGTSDSFAENTAVNTVIKTLAADAAVSYTIVEQTPSGKFAIQNTNELQLAAALDFETDTSYAITLRATDDGGGHSADISYTVTVTNVNEAPVFDPNTFSVTVDSGIISGTVHDASSQVSDPESDTITYTISGDDLSINADGVVSPAKRLTYTTASPSITATITASDGTLSGILTLTVNIRPVTWTTPTDGTSDSYAENTAVNTVIKTLAADAAVSYTIVEQTPSGKFAIQNTNELQLAAALNFETDTSYAITLRATDDGGGHSADISYTVTVTNVNEAPVFDPNTFSVTVDSGIISGTVHDASSQVTDPESDTITYTISGDELSINADGVVSPAKRLTYTTASPSITATITASDGTLSGILTLTVNIRPVTWTTPTDGTSASYAENTAVNTVIKTLAADAAVSYTIVDQTPSGKFAIQNTNELQLAAALDFETDTSYAITLRATDDGGGYSADISYTVTVTNVNEAPVFDPNTFSVTVDSGIISGTVHDASTQVSDPESDTITYTISGDDLSINADGVVSPAKRLTYTTASPSITATITASDGTLSGILTLTVNMRPVTWTTPTDGTSDSYAENTAVNTVIKTLAADAAVSYTIVEQTPSGKFAIQNTNELQLAAALDFETDTSYAITLRATDDGGGHSADISYTVTVTNVNEAPVFDPNTFSVTVDSGIISGTVHDASTQVSDPESDTITYTISGDDLSINADGVVSPAKRLTYTTASPSITATITASDGTLSGILTLTVNMRPVTWTSPTDGTSDSYAENTAVNTVIKILAADVAVSYTIVDQTPGGKFAIQNTNELQLAAALDFEIETSYTITLRATDDGGGHSADISYTVTVTDVNEAPVFDPNTFSVTVDSGISGTVHDASTQVSDPESDTMTYTISGDDLSINADGVVTPTTRLTYNTASPSITATITASDGTLSGTLTLTVNIRPVTWTTPTDGTSDSYAENTAVNTVIKTLAADAAVSYTIVEQTPSGKFAIQNTNELQLAATLDFETETSYTITLRATDDGGGHSADISYTVTVTDVNEAPVFDPNAFSVTVDSGIISGTVHDASTQVSDPEGDTITYTISGADLSIDENGVVTPATRLTYETASPSITATVTASDGTLSGTLTLTVNIRPVTWTTPTDGTSDSYAENTAVNTVIKTLAADAAVSYAIVEQIPSGKFAIHNTNELQLAAALDFETESSYTIKLRATDDGGGNSAVITYTVTVTDVNEVPVFDPSTQTVTVQSGISSGTVFDVSTIISDPEDNQITYSISGTDALSIDSSGVVTPVGTITYNSEAPSITATVTASDGSLTATLTLTVNIKTVPLWVNPASEASVSKAEDVSTDEVFYTLSATDDDGDTLTYSIKVQSVADFFTLGGTGTRNVLLKSGNSLDYETTQQYTLTFEVTDGTSDPVQSADLVITITDINDNAPTFSASTINVVVKDTDTVGDTIKELTATDADSSLNSNNVVTYSVVSGNDDGDFAISSSGVMTLETAVTMGSTYTIVVKAVDGGTPAKTGQATLQVTTATNSNPVLNALAASTAHTVTVPEDESIGTSLYEIDASDADGDELSYTIKSQTPSSGKFTLNGNILEISAALDYDTETSYSVVFEVDDLDGNTANKLTSGTLTLSVTDLNDHYPTFAREFYTLDIMEKQTEVVNVIQLTATDDDSDTSTNGAISYSIVGGDFFDQFTVDISSGQLATTNKGLLRSKQKYHVLAIQAKDGGSPARADSVHVMVNVTPLEDGGNGASETIISVVILTMCTLCSLLLSLK